MTEHHALVKALVADIPTGAIWPQALRERWLTAAAAVFDLVYVASETIDMREVLVRATATDAVSSKQLLRGETVFVETATEPNTKVADEPEPKVEVVAPIAQSVAPARNVGGRPRTTGPGRPDGIPTNLNMALDAIDHHEGKASASQIMAYVRRQYWPEAPGSWTASLYDHVTAKKLARDGINFVRPVDLSAEEKPKTPEAKAGSPAMEVTERIEGIKFEYAGKSTLLSKIEFRLAEALRRAMGKGHLDYAYLMQAGTAGQARRAGLSEKVWCMEAMMTLRPRLETIGLDVSHTPNFGYTMTAISA